MDLDSTRLELTVLPIIPVQFILESVFLGDGSLTTVKIIEDSWIRIKKN